jgi:hypothetical protein
MSSIYDNIKQPLLPELQAYLKQSYRADFCVGYFNLRGWQQIDGDIEQFDGGTVKLAGCWWACIACRRKSYGNHWQSELNRDECLMNQLSDWKT